MARKRSNAVFVQDPKYKHLHRRVDNAPTAEPVTKTRKRKADPK